MAEENPYPGMTRLECPLSCSAQRCEISGIAICAHPCKGGLQSTLMQDNAALRRYKAAEKVLKIDELKAAYEGETE